MDIGTGVNPVSKYQEISGQAKIELTNDIIENMANEISGKQLLILNKVLDETLTKYEVFIDNKIDVNENYQEVNQSLLQLFLKAKKVAGLSPRTLARYEQDIKRFYEYLPVSIHNCEADTIRDYLSWYPTASTRNVSKTMLDNIRRTLSSYFNWLQNEGYVLKNPMKRVPRIKVPKRQKHPITPLDVERIRDVIIASDDHTPFKKLMKARNLAIFELLLSSGIRCSELCSLNTNDLRFEDNSFHVIGKGDKERTCYFNEVTKLRIQQYLELRTDDEPALFIATKSGNHSVNKTSDGIYQRYGMHGVERMIRTYGKNAGIEYDIHPHRFRHTFATNMLHRGMPVEEVQKLLGHDDMKTTLIYAEVAQSDVKHSHQKYS